MQWKGNRLKPGLMLILLGLSLWGCAQTPPVLIDDSANIRKHEQLEMAPEPSGQSTDQELRMDMEGGG